MTTLDSSTRYALVTRARFLARRAELECRDPESGHVRPLSWAELDLRGAGHRRAGLYVLPRPLGLAVWQVRLLVVTLDSRPLARPALLEVEVGARPLRVTEAPTVSEADAPLVIRHRGRTWTRCDGDLIEADVAPSGAAGLWRISERRAAGTARYRLQCACGRFRYATRAAAQQVRECRICAWQLRVATQRGLTVAQRARALRPRLTVDAAERAVRRVVTDGLSARAAAREAGVAPSTVTRLLHRRGLR